MKNLKNIQMALIVTILVLFNLVLNAQDKSLVNISGHADCHDAILLSTSEYFGPTTAPKGFGKVIEYADNNINDKYNFENEHNTVWYRFYAQEDVELSFDIFPEDSNDDYDFLLYKIKNDAFFFCNYGIKKKYAEPIRSNISRNNKSLKSITGLSENASSNFVNAGIGRSHSKSISVKKGELYYLVVDNVYNNGSGHSIVFHDQNSLKYSGIVKDYRTGKPIRAEVTLADYKTGNIISRTVSSATTGKYTLMVNKHLINESNDYNLSFFIENYFFEDELIKGKEIILPRKKNVITSLIHLSKNKKVTIKNVNFYGDEAVVLPESQAALKKLYKLMKRNKTLVILIQGHTNGVGSESTLLYHQQLSDNRAKTIYDYLIERGIDKNRLSMKGYGCANMLYPEGITEEELKLNRRIEVKVLKY